MVDRLDNGRSTSQPMDSLLQRMAHRIVLWDGAMATMLFDHGLDPDTPPEHWNNARPASVSRIHAAYYAAGADVVQSNSFGICRVHGRGVPDTKLITEAARRAADLVRRVCPSGRLVAGNIGPTGLFTSLTNESAALFSEVEAVFHAAVAGLLDGGADLISIETMTRLSEARAALKAAHRLSAGPVAVSMTFRRTPAGFESFWGEPADYCARQLAGDGADVIGANCMEGCDVASVAGVLHKAAARPILIQPNAGHPIRAKGRLRYPSTVDDLVHAALAARSAGAGALGGCCGTTPEFIRELQQALEKEPFKLKNA